MRRDADNSTLMSKPIELEVSEMSQHADKPYRESQPMLGSNEGKIILKISTVFQIGSV